ncbi:TPA: YetF domain-containing protein [Streptococcus pneumoniae]
MKRLIDGKPTLLIKNGNIDPEACRSVGLSAIGCSPQTS